MKLFKLLWQRYQRTLIGLFFAIIGIYSMMAFSQINEWQKADTYMNSASFKQAYNQNPENFDSTERKNEKHLSVDQIITKGTQFWQKNNTISFFDKNNTRTNDNSRHIQVGLSAAVLALITIFVSLTGDIRGNFNGLLFGSKYSRKQILTTKISLLLGIPLVAVFVGELIYYGSIIAMVPSKHLNYDAQMFTWSASISCLLLFLILATLLIITTEVIGISFWAGVLYVCFLLSIIVFVGAVGVTVEHILRIVIKTTAERTVLVNNLFAFIAGIGGIIISVIILSLLLWWAFSLFQTSSLERVGKFVLREHLRWPLWWFTLVYTAFCLLTISFGSVGFNIIMPVIVIILNVVMYYLIFKPQSLRHPIKSIS